MWLFLAFVAIPLIEIALFIQVGGWIGLWPTLGLVLASAVLGTWLLRTQGRYTLWQLQGAIRDLRDPTGPIAHGAMILFAGALLLTPGFFTDLTGLLLLLPPVRRWLIGLVRQRLVVMPRDGWPAEPRRSRPDIIDAEYSEVDPAPRSDDSRARPPSGWTRH